MTFLNYLTSTLIHDRIQLLFLIYQPDASHLFKKEFYLRDPAVLICQLFFLKIILKYPLRIHKI